MKILVLITTYNRSEMLIDVLSDIENYQSGHEIHTIILDDHSDSDYSDVFDHIRENTSYHIDYYRMEEHQGKPYYWQMINYGYQLAKDTDFDYFIQVSDDIRLADDFFSEAVRLYNLIDGPDTACLNISWDKSRDCLPMWTPVQPKRIEIGTDKLIRTGWVDMGYICTKKYFHLMEYRIDPVSLKWSGNINRSSGVGMQISKRLYAMNKVIYQVSRSLVAHGDHDSVMHPDLRKKEPLIATI